MLLSEVHIDLGGVEIRVPQPLLQLEGRDTLLRFVGCKRVPQGMTAGSFRNPGSFRVLDDKFANPPLRYWLTLVV